MKSSLFSSPPLAPAPNSPAHSFLGGERSDTIACGQNAFGARGCEAHKGVLKGRYGDILYHVYC